MAQPAAHPPAGPTEAEPPAGFTLRRDPHTADPASVLVLVRSTGRFSESEQALAAELVTERLRSGPASGYEFLFLGAAGQLAGYACFGPIPCTVDRYDLYWIAVAPEHQGRGCGRWLLARSEADIAARGGRRVYVDTSSRPAYAPTRRFYECAGYQHDACLAGFYGPGDDKVVYLKILSPDPSVGPAP